MSEERCKHGIRHPWECKDCLYEDDRTLTAEESEQAEVLRHGYSWCRQSNCERCAWWRARMAEVMANAEREAFDPPRRLVFLAFLEEHGPQVGWQLIGYWQKHGHVWSYDVIWNLFELELLGYVRATDRDVPVKPDEDDTENNRNACWRITEAGRDALSHSRAS